MSLSPEVQSAVDEIRRNKSLVKSLQAERDLWKQKANDAQAKLDEIANVAKMSDEDRKAIKDASAEMDALNDELEGAAQENVKPETGAIAAAPAEPKPDPQAEYRDMTPAELADARGEAKGASDSMGSANPPAVEGAPLMPNLAFNPAGSGSPAAPAGDGQPAQPAAIETAGGFVVAGGGSTQRAPGSRPESPSSSLAVPDDPNAKAPASTADEVKSGLGDSSQNALIGNDLKPVPDAASQQAAAVNPAAEQARQEQLAAEMARRAENPQNLSEDDLAKQRGAEKDASKSEMSDQPA